MDILLDLYANWAMLSDSLWRTTRMCDNREDPRGNGVGPSQAPEVLVLLSGGVDSAACLAFYQETGRPVTAMFVDYGQPAAQQETVAAQDIAGHFGVALTKANWRGQVDKVEGFVSGRNAFLLMAALMELPFGATTISIGIHAGTRYEDCTPEFVQRMQSVADLYASGRVHVAAPFVIWTKAEIIAFCRSRRVPIDRTYSCERGEVTPCGKCLSCLDREAVHAHS